MEKTVRPKILPGFVAAVKTGCGTMYVVVTYHNDLPFEVFGILGRSGQCAKSQAEAVTRLVTLGLRSGVSIDAYTKQLSGIGCPSPGFDDGVRVLSCPDAIARGIKLIQEENKRGDTITKLNKKT